MPRWLKPVTRFRTGRFAVHMVRRYFAHDVGRQAAALAYYLLFSIFPFLIFISSLLGLLDLDISGIIESLQTLLPSQILDIIETYLYYVSHTSSTPMLWFGLFFTIYFPMRAASCLMHGVRRAYHLPKPKHPVAYTFRVLLCTVFLLVAVAVTFALATVGEQVLELVKTVIILPEAFVRYWIDWRFIALAAVMFAAVGLLYAAAQDSRRPAGQIVPGVFFSVGGWMIASAAYSFYVENFARYSVIYGALGAVIVLMVWLNLSAIILILGAEVNDTLLAMRLEDKNRKTRKTAVFHSDFYSGSGSNTGSNTGSNSGEGSF